MSSAEWMGAVGTLFGASGLVVTLTPHLVAAYKSRHETATAAEREETKRLEVAADVIKLHAEEHREDRDDHRRCRQEVEELRGYVSYADGKIDAQETRIAELSELVENCDKKHAATDRTLARLLDRLDKVERRSDPPRKAAE